MLLLVINLIRHIKDKLTIGQFTFGMANPLHRHFVLNFCLTFKVGHWISPPKIKVAKKVMQGQGPGLAFIHRAVPAKSMSRIMRSNINKPLCILLSKNYDCTILYGINPIFSTS